MGRNKLLIAALPFLAALYIIPINQPAEAKALLSCRSQTHGGVVACCEAAPKPYWFVEAKLTCESLAGCGGRVSDDGRCRLTPPKPSEGNIVQLPTIVIDVVDECRECD